MGSSNEKKPKSNDNTNNSKIQGKKNILNNIKSKKILKQIIANLEETLFLKIIKINKYY